MEGGTAGYCCRRWTAYATLVLEGAYIERGTSGRWSIEPGHVIAHSAFDCHDNLILREPTRVLNIPDPPALRLPPVFTAHDPDALIAAARQGAAEMHLLLRPDSVIPPEQDWPDLLATCLREEAIGITDWAQAAGLAPATVSRGFAAAFGVTPSGYRAEARVARALRLLVTGTDPLAQIAAACGFSDQAHLCRNVKAVSGYTPSQWRQVKSVQDLTRTGE